jgi:hypothetical protein
MNLNKLGWVRGKGKPPHPFFFVELLSSPLPPLGGGHINKRPKIDKRPRIDKRPK